MCEDHPFPGGRRKAGSKNSRALLIAGCLVGLPHISHMVTHMQRGARMELWRGDCLYFWNAGGCRDPSPIFFL